MKRILCAFLMIGVLLLVSACGDSPKPTPTEPTTVAQNNPTDILTTEPTSNQDEENASDNTKYTLTVEVPSDWTTVYVYTWDPETFGTFPGSPMTKESDNTYKYQIGDNVTNIIISNQDRTQTNDLKIVSGMDVKMVIGSDNMATIAYPDGNGGADIRIPSDVAVGELSNYRVVGNADWLGTWDAAFENGRMTKTGEGRYSKTFENAPAGNYEIKITQDGRWDNSYGDANGQNVTFTLNETADITVDFKLIDGVGSISVIGASNWLDAD